jgi:hypothetical protein
VSTKNLLLWRFHVKSRNIPAHLFQNLPKRFFTFFSTPIIYLFKKKVILVVKFSTPLKII